MSQYHHKDHYHQKAKLEGLPSRASYKLLEIQKKYTIIEEGHTVLDLGCAPGGWLVVSADMVGPQGRVIGVDLEPIDIALPPNVEAIVGDINNESVWGNLGARAQQVDVILSDMAPKTIGVKFVDSLKSTQLAEMALELCHDLLKEGGVFVTKIFPGGELPKFKNELKKYFAKNVQFIPDSSRKTSIETYLIAFDYKGPK